MKDEERKAVQDLWPHYRIDSDRALAFSPPSPEIHNAIKQTKATYHWPSYPSINDTPTHTIISRLLNRSINCWLIKAGCVLADDFSAHYLPAPFRGESIFRFKDVDGKPSYIRVTGTVRLYRPNSAPEEVIHHPAIRYSIRKMDWGGFVVRLRPGVTLFDGSHKLITGRKVGPRTKKVTRAYFNEKWRKRLIAFTTLLSDAAAQDKQSALKLGTLVTLTTDRSLDESALSSAPVSETDELAQDDVQVNADEMEETDNE